MLCILVAAAMSYGLPNEEKGQGVMEYSKAAIAQEFLSIIGDQLRLDAHRLPGNTTLFSLGLDCMRLLELISTVENRFNVCVGRRSFSLAFTLDDSIASLEGLLNASRSGVVEVFMPEGSD